MKPEWISEYASYDDMFVSSGYEYKSEYFGSYQGDIAVVFREGNRKGYLILGYGSCSGCDMLESVRPWCYHQDECDCDWSGVQDLRDALIRNIRWDEPLPKKGDPNYWWSYDDEVMIWLKENY